MKSVKIAALARVVRLCGGHVRGGNSPGSRFIVKELIRRQGCKFTIFKIPTLFFRALHCLVRAQNWGWLGFWRWVGVLDLNFKG